MNIAVITGASSGIGKEMTETLHNYFNDIDEVWVIARSEEKLKQLKSKFKIKVVAMDLLETQNLEVLKEMFQKNNVNIKILINSAGYGKFGSFKNIDTGSSLGMIDLNCRALVGVTEISIPFMQKGARILQVCSVASFLPIPLINVYAASKAFVQSYSLALKQELKSLGISVTTLCPNWTNTSFFKVAENVDSSKKAVKNYMFMLSPQKVAKVGLLALKKRKTFSIPGISGKLLFVATKLVPKRLAMKAWLINCNKELLK